MLISNQNHWLYFLFTPWHLQKAWEPGCFLMHLAASFNATQYFIPDYQLSIWAESSEHVYHI